MNTTLTFCEECRDDVDYIITKTSMVGTIKGEDYVYSGKEAHCIYCGSLVYVPEINDFNLKSLYDVYREKNGIISLEMILSIPKKYAIGKRPLSKLLGWGGNKPFPNIVMEICQRNNILIF